MAASDKQLGDLHKQVAVALSEQVVGFKEPQEDGSVKQVRPSPALLGAAIAFLKNNSITADVEDNAALRDLGAALKARSKKKLPQAMLDEAADSYSTSMGGTLQ